MSAIRIVAARELRERIRSRAFAFSSLALVAIVLAAVIIPTLDDDTVHLRAGLTGAAPAALTTALRDAARADDAQLALERFPTLAAGEAALRDGRVGVLVVDGRRLVFKADPDARLAALATAAIRGVDWTARAAASGLGPAQAAALARPADVPQRRLEPADPDRDARDAIAFGGLVLLLGVLLGYGSAVAEGVAQEKGGRIMELLLCRVRSRDLLAGKVLGIGLVGLAQMLLAVGAGAAAIVALDSVEVPAAVPEMLAASVLWFVLGFAFWSVAFAAVGALVSRVEDVQSAYAPLSWLLIASYFAAVVAAGAPDAWYVRLASLAPPTAPLVMPVRIAVAGVAPWESALAVTLMIVATVGLVRAAAAVYAGALLRTGSRTHLRDVWRVARG
jgi:ABC-2 type transport system permease protein